MLQTVEKTQGKNKYTLYKELYFVYVCFFYITWTRLCCSTPQSLSGEDAAHHLHGGQDPARSGQMSGRAETKSHSGPPLER